MPWHHVLSYASAAYPSPADCARSCGPERLAGPQLTLPAGTGLSGLGAGPGDSPDLPRQTGTAGLWQLLAGPGPAGRHPWGRRLDTGRAWHARRRIWACNGPHPPFRHGCPPDAAGMRRLDCLTTQPAVPFYAALGFRTRAGLTFRLAPGSFFRISACCGSCRPTSRPTSAKQKGPVFRPALCILFRSEGVIRCRP